MTSFITALPWGCGRSGCQAFSLGYFTIYIKIKGYVSCECYSFRHNILQLCCAATPEAAEDAPRYYFRSSCAGLIAHGRNEERSSSLYTCSAAAWRLPQASSVHWDGRVPPSISVFLQRSFSAISVTQNDSLCAPAGTR